MKTFRRLWLDDSGALIATEWVFAATLLVIGVVAAFTGIRNSLNATLGEVSETILDLNPAEHAGDAHHPCNARIENRIDVHVGPLQGPAAKPRPMTEREWRELDRMQNDQLPSD